jgi:tetratricopeptide (TPR) repeat protein
LRPIVAPSRLRRTIVAGLACFAWATASGDPLVVAAQATSLFDECEPEPGQRWTYDRLMCLRQAGTVHDARDEVVRRLRVMGAGDGEHPWETLVLAHVRLDQLRRAQAIALYETAAAGFAGSREAEGEVVARQNLATQYRLRGDVTLAGGQVALAVAAAEASKQPLTIARAAVIAAVHSIVTGGDIGRAHRVLLRADRLVSPAAPIGLRRTILFNLANASLYLGDTDAAIDALERHRALRAEDGSPQNAVTVEFNLLIARLMMNERRPTAGAREQLMASAESVLTEARNLHEPLVEAQAHQVLGDLSARGDPDRAAVHLQRCLELESTLGFPSLRAACLWSLSSLESARDPRRAERSSTEALALLDGDHDRLLLAYAWQARLRMVWRSLPAEMAIAQSQEALDAIERLRSTQTGESSRAGLFGNWTRDYQWLTGQLLQAQPPRLAPAFEVGERLRSRVLLERVAQAGGGNATASTASAAGGQLAERIAATQRRLLSTPLDEAERRTLLGQLRLLELEREDLNEGRVQALPAGALPPASLEAVQRALDDGEAMVWFSIAPWKDVYDGFGGGSWAVTITRQAATMHPLPATDQLDGQIGALVGLLRDRHSDPQLWTPAVRKLGEALLGDALAGLPSTTTRLVIVTAAALHRMPFEVLTLTAGPMLGERFDISEVPSATLWLRLRESVPATRGDGVLVFADPDLDYRTAGGSPDGETRFEALPGARHEARAIAGILGLEAPQVVDGSAASERFLKNAPLGTLAILHLAAHARADAAFPERSAVFLAPGDPREDGWLQPGEIAELDLRGRLVVLSACDSAEGTLLSGEGPLSLARAFFSAGARGVVATRWPLRDDDAAFMMEHFYQALAAGQNVAGALRQARRDAIDAGLPAAAWAGFAALGDGLQQPLTPRPGRASDRRSVVAVVVIVTIAIAVGWQRRRRRRHDPATTRSGRFLGLPF